MKILAVNHGPHVHEDLLPHDNWLTGCGWWRVSMKNADEVQYLIQHDGEKVIEVGTVTGWVHPARRHVAAWPKLQGRKHFQCSPVVPEWLEALIGEPWTGNRNPVQVLDYSDEIEVGA